MKSYLASFAFLLFSNFISAQDINLKGKWKVNCALEKKDENTLHVCDICPKTVLSNNMAIVEEFEIFITENALKFTNDEVKVEIPYELDKSTFTLKFKYAQKDYAFKAMIVSDPFVQILVAETGEVLYLKKLL